jgi:hypothetical protein
MGHGPSLQIDDERLLLVLEPAQKQLVLAAIDYQRASQSIKRRRDNNHATAKKHHPKYWQWGRKWGNKASTHKQTETTGS